MLPHGTYGSKGAVGGGTILENVCEEPKWKFKHAGINLEVRNELNSYVELA